MSASPQGVIGDLIREKAELEAENQALRVACRAAKRALSALDRVSMYGAADLVRDRARTALARIDDALGLEEATPAPTIAGLRAALEQLEWVKAGGVEGKYETWEPPAAWTNPPDIDILVPLNAGFRDAPRLLERAIASLRLYSGPHEHPLIDDALRQAAKAGRS